MASQSPEREIGIRGPFDAYDTKKSMLKMVKKFLRRTGLLDDARYFRIGAFLARRPFGGKQVEYLRRAYEEEDRQSEHSASSSSEDSDAAPGDALGRSNILNDHKELRRQYEYDRLNEEGDRGRWQIFWRQKWRVHALVLCCSLGAAIQGWDETAVNGGKDDLGVLQLGFLLICYASTTLLSRHFPNYRSSCAHWAHKLSTILDVHCFLLVG